LETWIECVAKTKINAIPTDFTMILSTVMTWLPIQEIINHTHFLQEITTANNKCPSYNQQNIITRILWTQRTSKVKQNPSKELAITDRFRLFK